MVDVSREGTRYVLSLSLSWVLFGRETEIGKGRYHGSGTGNEIGM
jgi:hypothetical protein